jgi:hypothetical protein
VADDQNMGIPRRLAIGLVCALIGGAAIPTLALSDGGLLGGGGNSPVPSLALPSVSVPAPQLPATPVTPKDNPVQQVINTVDNTVNQTAGQVQQVVNNPPTGGGSGGGGNSSGGNGNSGSSGSSGSSGTAVQTADSGSTSGDPASAGASQTSSGGSSHKSSKTHGSGGSGGGGAATGGSAGSGTANVNAVTPAAGSDPAGKAKDPKPKRDGSVLTRTVHDIVHVLPGWLKPVLVALALAILGLALNSFFHSRRARKLARLRDELLDEVGVLQKALLPEVPDRIGGLAVTVAYSPAEGPAAGGDFYDVFPLRGDRVGILVGDISGHGKRALEHTSLLRYTIRAYLDAGLDPRAAITVASETLEDDLDGDFATVVVAIYDSENGMLTYSTAGHPPPLALGPGEFEPVTVCSSPPIGLEQRTGLRQTTVTLPRGTDVVLYTDGVVEARKDGEMFGRDRFTELVGEQRPQPVAFDVLTRVSQEIDQSSDDMAVCIFTVEGKRAVPAFRLEELELKAGELDEPHAKNFLEACGVPDSRIGDALSSLKTTAGEFGGAVLRVRMETDGTSVTVASPPGATSDLPALHGVRLAAPIDL